MMPTGRPTAAYYGPSPLLILLGLLILFGAILGGGLYVFSATSVTLRIDSAFTTVHTHQMTVRGLLSEVGVSLEAQDILTPPLDSPIRAGLVVSIDHAHSVLVAVDGTTRRVLTHQTNPRAILTENQIALGGHDALILTSADDLIIRRATSISVIDDGKTETRFTIDETVGGALADAAIPLYLADSVTPAISEPISAGLTIRIKRSAAVTFLVDGRTLAARTHGATVGEALGGAGIALVGLDRSEPTADVTFRAGMSIRIIRVTEAEEIERTDLPFKRIAQPDPTLELDMRRVIDPGVPGIQEVHVRVRREDGVVVSRSAPLSWQTQPPHDQVEAVGTRVVLHTLDTPDGPISYWRVIHMRVASYKPASTGKSTDDPTYGITANGQRLHKGLVAVDPTVIPLGTALYVPKYGKAVAADTGGAVIGATIDLGYDDADYQEWSGTVDVYLLAPAPPADLIKPPPEITQ